MSRLVFMILLINAVTSCKQTGWSSWINDRKASKASLPGEENATELKNPGGDFENMNATARDTFCASGHGVITDIECVTVNNGTNYTHAQSGKHAMSCEAANGFKCFNRHVDGGSCLNYKIRFFCNCTSPILTLTSGQRNTSPTSLKITSPETTQSSTTKDNPGKSLSTLAKTKSPTKRPALVSPMKGTSISKIKGAAKQAKNSATVATIWMRTCFIWALASILFTTNFKC